MADNATRTKVTILTGSYRIKGFIDLIPGARVTDYVNDAKGFMGPPSFEKARVEVPAGERRIVVHVSY